jgi:hypothetical protein
VPASMEKSVFESPVFRQIHPAVVLILPSGCAPVGGFEWERQAGAEW